MQELVDTLTTFVLACSDWSQNYDWAISNESFIEAVTCPYTDTMGMPAFASFVMLGVVNLPIYIKQDSVLIPFVLTLVIGGVYLTQTASMLQGIGILVILLVFGLGPVLVLKRIQR